MWTEMVCADTILHNLDDQERLDHILGYSPAEGPIVLQLGGNSPEKLGKCAEIARRLYGYDEINLNCGCPSDRVAGKGAFGACLMKTPRIVAECAAAIGNHKQFPVSVKCRLGVDDLDSDEFFGNFVDEISDHCSLLTVHCRIALLKGLSPHQNRTIPPLNFPRARKILGERPSMWYTVNGGIQSLDEILEISREAPGNFLGCMVGRAISNNICMLAETDTKIYNKISDPISAFSRRTLLESYGEYLHDRYDEIWEESKQKISAFVPIRPILSIFHGEHGNRKWRQHVDSLSKERGISPARILEKIVETWESPETLDRPIVDGREVRD